MKFHKTDNGRICRSFKDDCVVRSVSLATDQSYDQTFKELMTLGLEVGAYPNHDKVWIRYLEDKGFVKNKPPRLNGKLIKLENWSDHPQVAVVRNSGHVTALVDGILHDEWDCRYRPVNSYWTYTEDKLTSSCPVL
jgi:hypothetical protein|tara:strand:+ start:1412 stop:1819 length:408 start_codon:yes stop_codon:yes gene_type:complete